jgi:hypothetical protein
MLVLPARQPQFEDRAFPIHPFQTYLTKLNFVNRSGIRNGSASTHSASHHHHIAELTGKSQSTSLQVRAPYATKLRFWAMNRMKKSIDRIVPVAGLTNP